MASIRERTPSIGSTSKRTATPAPAVDENRFEEFEKNGSMWAWTNSVRVGAELEFHNDTIDSKQEGIFKGLECWRWDDALGEEVPGSEVADLTQSDIDAWLHKPIPTHNGKPPSAGFKVLHIKQGHRSDMRLSFENYMDMLRLFGLPPIDMHPASTTAGACGMFRTKEGSYIIMQKRIPVGEQISSLLRYDPSTNISYGYLSYEASPSTIPLNFDWMNKIQYQFAQCTHPLLLPTLLLDCQIKDKVENSDNVDTELTELESQTRFSATDDTASINGEQNLQGLVRILGAQHSYFFRNQASLVALQYGLKSIMRILDDMDKRLPDTIKASLSQSSIELHERIDFLTSLIDHGLLLRNIEQRLNAQQAVLFNLIAQQDSKYNIELAKDSKELAASSKQDSSAMKIIAVLTTLFLPGTFVSTFFAMPLFNWQEPAITHVTTQHFWVFWAVTGPLTLSTMIIVISWALWHGQQTKSMLQRARESAEEAVRGPDRNEETQTLLSSARSTSIAQRRPRFRPTFTNGWFDKEARDMV